MCVLVIIVFTTAINKTKEEYFVGGQLIIIANICRFNDSWKDKSTENFFKNLIISTII